MTWHDEGLHTLWEGRTAADVVFRGRPADVLYYIKLIERALDIGMRWPIGDFWLMEDLILAACWWRTRTATRIEVS